MSYGTNVIIPSNSGTQRLVPGGMQFPTLAILNPNDGIIYVSVDNPITNVMGSGSWDWKIPSQSYALLPGTPDWHSVGLWYVDQSGAGRAGEITFFPVAQKYPVPVFQAIGRSLLASQTTLDIVEGLVPANPALGQLRLWADASDDLHLLNSSGVDTQVVDFETVLGGILSGTLPNPTIATAGITSAMMGALSVGQANLIDGSVVNAKMGAGAASANIGALGGVLTGTLPNPGLVIGYARVNTGTSTNLVAATWTTILSLSLVAGTWLICAGAEIINDAGILNFVEMRITDGSTVSQSAGSSLQTTTTETMIIPPYIVIPGGSTTYNFQAYAANGAARAYPISATTGQANATVMTAIRLA